MSDVFALAVQQSVPNRGRKAKKQLPPQVPAKRGELFVLTDHVCRACGGRILRAWAEKTVRGEAVTTFRCADCECTGTGSPNSICACGAKFNTQRSMGLHCTKNPEAKPAIVVPGTCRIVVSEVA